MPKKKSSPVWILRAILMKYGCLLTIGVMAGLVSLISLIVMKSCGVSEEKARAVSSDAGDKALFVLVAFVLITGTSYWIWIGFRMFRARKLPPPLPPPPLPVPDRPRPLVQNAGPLVAPPKSPDDAVSLDYSLSGMDHVGERLDGPSELMPGYKDDSL